MKTKLAVLLGSALFLAGCDSRQDSTIADSPRVDYDRYTDESTPAMTNERPSQDPMIGQRSEPSQSFGAQDSELDSEPESQRFSERDSLQPGAVPSETDPESSELAQDQETELFNQERSAEQQQQQPEFAQDPESDLFNQERSAEQQQQQSELAQDQETDLFNQDPSAEQQQQQSELAQDQETDLFNQGRSAELQQQQPEFAQDPETDRFSPQQSAEQLEEPRMAQEPFGGQQAGTSVVKASELMGVEVTNAQDEQLGSIQDLVIDPQTGRISYVALSSGGFLGVGDKLVAVPLETIQVQHQGEGDSKEMKLTMAASKEQIESAQGFSEDQWPQGPNQAWGAASPANLESKYGEPAEKSEDPQALRDRGQPSDSQDLSIIKSGGDRSSGQPQQGPSGADPADRNLTLHIQKELESDTELASAAQNVQVKVQNDQVVLSGTVQSEQHKKQIEERAQEIIGESLEIQNDLKVQGQE